MIAPFQTPLWRLPRLQQVGIYAAPAIIILLLWIPVFNHYYVPSVAMTDEMVNAARRSPRDHVFEEIRNFRFFERLDKGEQELIAQAEGFLNKKAEDNHSKQFPFNTIRASSMLLDAYRISGREEFFRKAEEMILDWALYERGAWLPEGFLWNDHATAAGVLVLANFWGIYRNHPGYKPEVAKIILGLAARSSRLLAEPSHYTFNSNHGVMQNLALWHFSLAFPSLPNAGDYRKLAFDRMRDQIDLYANEEGAILEHSAWYQQAGIEFLGMALKYLTLTKTPIPEDWIRRYEKAKDFYAHLRRPDGSLPLFGDTRSGRDDTGPLVTSLGFNGQTKPLHYRNDWVPRRPFTLLPIAGYAVWWDGLGNWPNSRGLSQTAVVWSHFPGHGHKHADEMSVLLWAGGETWWTNVGYWPYGSRGRSEAVSWDGSNAPHLIGEKSNGERKTRLRSHAWSDDLVVIDLERQTPGEYVIRRQVINLKKTIWVVLDHLSGGGRSRTVWTTGHNISLSNGPMARSYRLKGQIRDVSLTAFLLGSEGMDVGQLRGSQAPFAGWEVVGSAPRPASAIVIEQPANDAWSAVVWSLENGAIPSVQFVGRPGIAYWKNAEDWKLALPLSSGTIDLTRRDDSMTIDAAGTRDSGNFKLTKGLEPSDKIAGIRDHYARMSNQYPTFKTFIDYRSKITWLIISLFLAQQICFSVYGRASGKHLANMKVLSLFGWLIGGMLLIAYFDALVSLYSQGGFSNVFSSFTGPSQPTLRF